MKYFWASVAIFLGSICPAFANTELTPESWVDLRYRVINFVLFASVLAWLLGKRIVKYYAARKNKIISDLAELEKARIDALARLKGVETQISHLEEEGAAMLAEYKAQGESIEKMIVARAEETARQIAAQAQFAVENEAVMALENLRFEMADMVVQVTEDMLKKELGQQDQEKLIDKYLSKVVLN